MGIAKLPINEIYEIEDERMGRLRWGNYLLNEKLPCDVFHRHDKRKYQKSFIAFEKLTEEKHPPLMPYEEQRWLYFDVEYRSQILQYLFDLAKQRRSLSVSERLSLIGECIDQYFTDVVSFGCGRATPVEGKGIGEEMAYLIKEHSDLTPWMLNLEAFTQQKFSANCLVSLFSAWVVSRMSWGSPVTISQVVLGAIFHDIGEHRLHPRVRAKKHHQLSEDDIFEWHQHPKLGVDFLDQSHWIPEAVKQVVYQHHELTNGKGFPNHLKDHAIYPMAKVVGFVSAYVEFLFFHKLSPLNAACAFAHRPEVREKYDPTVVREFLGCFIMKS